MKTNNILIFNDNFIYLKNKKFKKIIKYKIKNVVKYGRILDTEKFLKTYNKFIKEYKLNNNLFGETIKVIVNPTYSNVDINFIKNVFESLNYRKVVIEKENKLYKLNTKLAYLNINDSFLVLSYIDEYKKERFRLIPVDYFKNLFDLMEYIKYVINDKELFIFGYGDVLNEIFNNFEVKFLNKTYIFSENENYLINRASC